MGVYNSYNAATLGFHTGYLARAGLLAIGATNAVPNLAPVGGKTPIIGTNPISYAVPAPGGEIAFLVDQSATHVAWTAVKRAAEAGEPIPLGWALDEDGNPTTDAAAGLLVDGACGRGQRVQHRASGRGSMRGPRRGKLGPDQGSFTEDDGKPIDNGQFW